MNSDDLNLEFALNSLFVMLIFFVVVAIIVFVLYKTFSKSKEKQVEGETVAAMLDN